MVLAPLVLNPTVSHKFTHQNFSLAERVVPLNAGRPTIPPVEHAHRIAFSPSWEAQRHHHFNALTSRLSNLKNEQCF